MPNRESAPEWGSNDIWKKKVSVADNDHIPYQDAPGRYLSLLDYDYAVQVDEALNRMTLPGMPKSTS